MKNKILLLLLSAATYLSGYSLPKLNSYPSAKATIYLDFDGEAINNVLWNGGKAFTAQPSGLNDAQVNEIFNRVSEDYRPFDINITTDETVYLAAPANKRFRVVVTTTSSWYPGVGGVTYVGSFTWGDDTPGFVFCDRLGPNNPKEVAECCSHESGHSLGLSHQSKYDATCNLTAKYNDGIGQGEIGWAPIMGNSYYRNMSGWNNGPTPYGCSNVQDNLSTIVTQNGFSYRKDDFSNELDETTSSLDISSININGLISTNTDKDAFKFSLKDNAAFRLDAKPFSVNANNEGADLDIKLELFDAAKNLLRTYNPSDVMDATIDTLLNAGDYYLVISGTGNSNASEYSSLGSYYITGAAKELPVCSVTLSGLVDGNKHDLNWSLTCYQVLKDISIQTSADGINFIDEATAAAQQTSFSKAAPTQADIFYRLKITSSSGRIVYSNIVLLKKVAEPIVAFKVQTFVTTDMNVTAPADFKYAITDLRGNALQQGNGTTGNNRISMYNKPAGMYVVQLFVNNTRQTIKIIKQ